MRQLDIRFVKESDAKRLDYQMQVMNRLQEVLTKRIAEKFDDVNIRIRFSSAQGFDVPGFGKEEKKKFERYLEELWEDSTLLDL